MEINTDLILQELLASPFSATAREAAAQLSEAWIGDSPNRDSTLRVVAVECGFTMWLDPSTLIIGVQDAIFHDGQSYVGGEWKSAKEPKRNKDGTDSAWWNEEVWLSQIVNGPQLGIYALAMNRAIYWPKGVSKPIRLEAENPKIMVRAAVKSARPVIWPTDPSRGVFEFPNAMLPYIQNALLVRAAQIRAARKAGVAPWQLRGMQCTKFNRECPHLEACKTFAYADKKGEPLFNKHDPAYELALANVPSGDLANPDLVVLSASSYSDSTDCMEKYRILNCGLGPKDESLALETGGAMHSALSAFYRQMIA